MADTAVAVTAGSGTNIDTRTESTNGNHRQVVVLGDPATNAGVAPVDATAGLKVDLGTDNDVVVSATDLDIRPLVNTDVVTTELSATDNAVLDAIAASTAAIETAVEGTLTVTGGGGGVEYTQGDTDATIVGSAVMMEVAGDALQPIQGTVADGLLVNLGANNDISGTVTANLSATDNAVLDAIEADTTTIAAKDFATETTLTSLTDNTLDVANATVVDDAAFSVATNRVVMDGFLFDDVAPDSVNEGDAGAGRMSANRNQYVQIRDAAGNERGLNIAADGSLAITVSSVPSHAVTATDLDIRNLAPATDTVAIGDGTATATVRNLAANDALNVSIVDGSGDQITSFGGGTQYTEDAASAANPVGTAPILVRKDTPSSEVTTDGDNVAQRGTTYGAAYVTLLDTAGSPVSVGGGTQYTEDAAAAANPIGTAIIGVRADTLAGITTTDGDNVAARMTDKGELYVKHVDAIPVTNSGITTIAGAVAGTEMQVDVLTMPTVTVNSHAVTNAGTFLVQNNAATPAGTNNIGDVDVLTVNGVAPAFDTGLRGATVQRVTIATDDSVPVTGTFWQATQPVSLTSTTVTGTVAVTQSGTWDEVGINDSGNSITVDAPVGTPAFVRLSDGASAITTLPVSLASVPSHAVTNAGTFVTQENGALLTAAQLIDDTIFADDAGVTLGTSKGNISAGVAVATDGTDPTAVSAEGDAAALRTDMNRLLIVNQTHPRFWHVSADYASAQTNASVKASPGASLSLYITDIQISNGATAGNITLLDGSGGTVLYEVYPAINGGAVLSLRSPIKLTANTALCITSTTVTTHSVFVSGYIAA